MAVMGVVLAHAQVPFVSGGVVGVDAFFVVSGFLITGLLLREHETSGRIDFRAFYLRRARRLLPALVVVCAVSFVAFLVVRPFDTRTTLVGIGASLVYASSWLRAFDVSDLGWFGHTWSLSIEEYFYVVWPLALAWMVRRRRDRALFRAVALLYGASVLYRVAYAVAGGSAARLYNSPDLRAEQLLIGCLLAVALPIGGTRRLPATWKRPLDIVVSVCLADLARTIVLPGALGGATAYVGTTLVALEAAVVVAYVVSYGSGWLARLLSIPVLVWTGRRSYGIYLWHAPLLGLLYLEGQPAAYRAAGRAAALALTLLVAALSYTYVESRFYRRRTV